MARVITKLLPSLQRLYDLFYLLSETVVDAFLRVYLLTSSAERLLQLVFQLANVHVRASVPYYNSFSLVLMTWYFLVLFFFFSIFVQSVARRRSAYLVPARRGLVVAALLRRQAARSTAAAAAFALAKTVVYTVKARPRASRVGLYVHRAPLTSTEKITFLFVSVRLLC